MSDVGPVPDLGLGYLGRGADRSLNFFLKKSVNKLEGGDLNARSVRVPRTRERRVLSIGLEAPSPASCRNRSPAPAKWRSTDFRSPMTPSSGRGYPCGDKCENRKFHPGNGRHAGRLCPLERAAQPATNCRFDDSPVGPVNTGVRRRPFPPPKKASGRTTTALEFDLRVATANDRVSGALAFEESPSETRTNAVVVIAVHRCRRTGGVANGKTRFRR